jgi:hypothetical protein
MPGLVPGIHVFKIDRIKGVHGRDKPGHDESVRPNRSDVYAPGAVSS